jgi:hypothetical protein
VSAANALIPPTATTSSSQADKYADRILRSAKLKDKETTTNNKKANVLRWGLPSRIATRNTYRHKKGGRSKNEKRTRDALQGNRKYQEEEQGDLRD